MKVLRMRGYVSDQFRYKVESSQKTNSVNRTGIFSTSMYIPSTGTPQCTAHKSSVCTLGTPVNLDQLKFAAGDDSEFWVYEARY